jgi:hypothetical protein
LRLGLRRRSGLLDRRWSRSARPGKLEILELRIADRRILWRRRGRRLLLRLRKRARAAKGKRADHYLPRCFDHEDL